MFLRMVTHIIHAEESEKNAETYARSVLSALRSTQGCAFASLMQNTANPQECISLTIWDSRKASTDYEESGLYLKLVDSLRPYFLESTEWKLELSEDLSLEYTPLKVEPTVERFDESVADSGNIFRLRANPFAVHLLTLSVNEEQRAAFKSTFSTVVHPKYKLHKGFIDLVMVRQERKFHIISFWDETVDIGPSSGIQSIDQLIESIYKVLPSFVRWRISHTNDVHMSSSSEDLRSATYRCLTAEWFTR